MSLRLSIHTVVLACLGYAAACPSARAEEPARPNVLLILLDNVGYGDLGCYGSSRARTPHIDQLAREGVRCTDFSIASPSCTPSRGALLTGRHPERTGLNYQMPSVEKPGQGLPPAEKILPQYLKPLGYATGAFGKWNIGFAPGCRPTERGFDAFFGHVSGNINYYTHRYHGRNDLRRGTEEVKVEGYATDLFANAAIDFIRQHRQGPFFVYLPFNAPHFPMEHQFEPGEKLEWQVPARYLAMHGAAADEPDPRTRFQAVLTAVDDAVGRVLACLEELRLRERTLVLLLSDNGAFMLPGRGLEVQSNGPFRDGGVTTYEGGLRVPCLVRWPGRVQPGSLCPAMLSSLDLLPFIVRAASGTLPGDRILDGKDPTAALTGQGPSPHQELFWSWRTWSGMRSGSYKLVRRTPRSPWELYDLATDLGETRDLAREQPQRVAELAARYARWQNEVKNP